MSEEPYVQWYCVDCHTWNFLEKPCSVCGKKISKPYHIRPYGKKAKKDYNDMWKYVFEVMK